MIKRYSPAELAEMPTLTQGQANDLKVEGEDDRGLYRVWLSRVGVADGAAKDNAITVERFNSTTGEWRTTSTY